MIFTSTDLAARIERADSSFLAEAVTSSQSGDPNAFARPIAGGYATFAFAGSPVNKIAGLGFAGALDERELEELELAYSKRGTPVLAEVSSLADPSIVRTLTKRGYQLVGFENVLGCQLPIASETAPPPGCAFEIAGPEEAETWTNVTIDGFAAPDTQGVASHESFERADLERTIRDMTACTGYVRILVRRNGEPAAGASMRIRDGIAQLCGAATLPDHRRRGIQSALLADRLARAGRAGCDLAVVTTLPGSKSQQNVQRQGFELLYTRAVLLRG